ncbi:hypothetical protein EI168_02660 [Halomonas sp. FME1]|uniref:Uncharacterized protein n=1 Tax=Halomonas casei TaxID=2742613 RepID=A0ABR9EXR5_9GAMM|nr:MULTISPECIES: hypothetical protein [Halomonas]MBE0399010.1 hypothetical protein [Halomonas casei]PCC23004.1 hypothetical protein CIK78_13585 [Halomonas sp. JB37]
MRLIIAAALALCATTASAQEDLSYHFGYALQAAGMCPGLQVRIDTERKADAKYGRSVRDGAQHMDGLYAAMDDAGNACNIAWQRYGCSGNTEPRLMQSSATASNPTLCQY